MKIINGNVKGNLTSLCFQRKPCAYPSKIIECWSSDSMNNGVSSPGEPKLQNFGSEQWMLDPEENQFLFLVSYLPTVSGMKSLI